MALTPRRRDATLKGVKVARRLAAACCAALALVGSAACGKKGPPLAPYVLLPAAPVYRLDQALDSDFARATGMVASVPHPAKGELRVIANPIRVDGRRLSQEACAPLGADNKKYLGK